MGNMSGIAGRVWRQAGWGGRLGGVAGRVGWLVGGWQGRVAGLVGWRAGSGGGKGRVAGRVIGEWWIFRVKNVLV